MKCRLRPNAKQYVKSSITTNQDKLKISKAFIRSLSTYPFIESLEILSHYSKDKTQETLIDLVRRLKNKEVIEYNLSVNLDNLEKSNDETEDTNSTANTEKEEKKENTGRIVNFKLLLKYDSYAEFEYIVKKESTFETREKMYSNVYSIIADVLLSIVNLKTYNGDKIPEHFYLENDIEVTVGDFIVGKELNKGIRMMCMLPVKNELIKRKIENKIEEKDK